MRLSVRELKGIGEKTEKLFGRLGVVTLQDLLSYYPRTYEIFQEPQPVEKWTDKGVQAVYAEIDTKISVKQTGNSSIVTTDVRHGKERVSLIWFRMPYLKSTLKRGQSYVFRGRVVQKGRNWEMEQPKIYSPAQYRERLHRMQPVYGLTKGLTNQTVVKAVSQALEKYAPTGDYLPEYIRGRYDLMDYPQAVASVHFPGNWQDYQEARNRLAFDEFFLFILEIRRLKAKTETGENHYLMEPVSDTEYILEHLPYQLTKAQRKVWKEIKGDLEGNHLMSRLVQGDVGSGKTILAYLSMVMAAGNGYQAAFMAPTEVLAAQHYQGLLRLLRDHGLEHIHLELLTGSQSRKEKREIYARLQSGEIQLVIGTHALIQEQVHFQSLGLVITDEQHRFGVKQRESLSLRGGHPHVLVMSATPIPRTLAMIVYGDLDISVLDELPASRLPIKNCVVGTEYRPNAYRFMEKQIAQGRQVYVVCPMVEESEGMEGENVLDYASHLRFVFPAHIRIGILHGKMKAGEKNQVMEAFARHELDVLVSTTVIEVGVDVPNAAVIMVENAERFGLAQLHQLRGRVGRGEHQSYCIFVQGTQEKETKKRLEILNQSNDGFYIAAEDLKLRGPGDLLGIRQSGLMNFKIGDIYNDSQTLRQAAEAAGELLDGDPLLKMPEHGPLKEKMENMSCIFDTNVVL